jgi:hypothetical protein
VGELYRAVTIAVFMNYIQRYPLKSMLTEFKGLFWKEFSGILQGGCDPKPNSIDDIISKELTFFKNEITLSGRFVASSALVQNIFTCYISTISRIPLVIVGEPGSSKTSAVKILLTKLVGDNSESDLLKAAPQAICTEF